MTRKEIARLEAAGLLFLLWLTGCSVESKQVAATPRIAPTCVERQLVSPAAHPYVIDPDGRAKKLDWLQFQARKSGVRMIFTGPANFVPSHGGRIYLCETDFGIFGPDGLVPYFVRVGK